MAALDDLNAAVSALQIEQEEVLSTVNAEVDKIKTLTDKIAATPNVDPAIAAAAKSITDSVAAMHAAMPTA